MVEQGFEGVGLVIFVGRDGLPIAGVDQRRLLFVIFERINVTEAHGSLLDGPIQVERGANFKTE